MTLGDLLIELRSNILHDRSDQIAGASDYLWSDATLVNYINEAQRRFARKSLILRDGVTPEVTQVTLKSGVIEYQLHESVLAVLSAHLDGDTADLARAGHSALDTYRVPDAYFFDPAQLASLPPGKPVAYATDEYLGFDDAGSVSVPMLRLYPAPDAAHAGVVARLRVVRLPIDRLDLDHLTRVPEIPEDHHLEMLDWAAYLALRIVDQDGGMPARAAEFRASFEEHVAAARKAVLRKLFTPMPWGFGRNAWSWER